MMFLAALETGMAIATTIETHNMKVKTYGTQQQQQRTKDTA